MNKNEGEGRIVITGGSGFLGEAVYKKIRKENPTIPVFFLLNNTIPSYIKDSPYTSYVLIGENKDMKKFFQKGDKVLHFAGKTHSTSRKEYYEINYIFTKQLVEAAHAAGGAD